MSQVTEWIEQYRTGLLDLDALIENLQGFDFAVPSRFEEIPSNLSEAEDQAEDRSYDEDGTMDEVYLARDRGLIDADDLLAIVAALE